jgi:tRNA A-37 threonylcarbamoyl transferase component Bud32
MTRPLKIEYKNFHIYCQSPEIKPASLVDAFSKARTLEQKGRGGIRILDLEGKKFACRKYIHGGLFRAITKDLFFGPERALKEMEILSYLESSGFPVVHPVAVFVEKRGIGTHPYLLTALEEDALDLPEFLKRSPRKTRYRTARELARLFLSLESLGVYHRDLHLNNVLVSTEKGLIFLDFDRAYRKSITGKDMEQMFWRLNRYVEKMAKNGCINLDPRERALFLRTYEKLSGRQVMRAMEKGLNTKTLTAKIGWRIESFLYGGVK